MIRTPTFIPLLAIAAALGAVDMDYVDVRLGGGVLSNEFRGASDTTFTDSSSGITTTSSSGDSGRNSDHNYRGQLAVVWGRLGPAGGLIVGADAAVNFARFDNGSQEADATTPVVDVLIGYGLAVAPGWHFEVAPFAGVGRTYYSVRDNGSSHTSKDWQGYYEYGAKAGTYFTFANALQVGVEVPYLVGHFNADYNHDESNGTYRVSDSRRNQGFGLLVTLGTRF